MTVGQCLDDAALSLRLAEQQLQELTVRDWYGLTAAIVARDNLYRELSRFLTVLRGWELPQPLPIDQASAVLGIVPSIRVDKTKVLLVGIVAATLGVHDVPRALLRARDSAASTLMKAADAIGFATEIITTHVAPDVPTRPWTSPVRFLTGEGAALVRGAERTEALGEAARLTMMALAVDRTLATHRMASQDVLVSEQWALLERWVAGRYSRTLIGMTSEPPAHLLRALAPAPPTEQSQGPRAITSWADVARTVDTARSALRRNHDLATVGAVWATARFGFAVTAALWRANSSSEPDTITVAQGKRWHELAAAATAVGDIRDFVPMPFVRELDSAQEWIRRQMAGGKGISLAHARAIGGLHHNVLRLCDDLWAGLRDASHRRCLMTARMEMQKPPGSRIFLATAQMEQAKPDDPAVMALLRSLWRVAEVHQPVSSLESEASAVAKAWPKTVNESQLTDTRRNATGMSNGGVAVRQPTKDAGERQER